MTKNEIFDMLDKLCISKDQYIVIGKASLVCQDIILNVDGVDIACSKTFFDKLDWPTKIKYNSLIKYNGTFDVNCIFYDEKNIIEINGYKFMNLESCYELEKNTNNLSDKKLIKDLEMKICLNDNYYFERKLISNGLNFIAGVDEVGRGPLVGPVVAACVVLPKKFSLNGLTDSKKLSEKKRDIFYDLIMEQALGIGVGIIDREAIDEVNIYEATKLAMKEAIKNCSCKIDHVLIDAMKLDINVPTTSIIKGDLKSITISAASVIAKVTRDRLLNELDLKYPMYDFKNNKGYPTKKHLEAIKKYGIIDEHRRSYGPVIEYLESIKD